MRLALSDEQFNVLNRMLVGDRLYGHGPSGECPSAWHTAGTTERGTHCYSWWSPQYGTACNGLLKRGLIERRADGGWQVSAAGLAAWSARVEGK